MVIQSRRSEDHLHTDVILSKITEYDIFVYYIPSFKNLGKKFRSELREDNSPTVSIIAYNNKLLYKDFGNPDHTFDCFNYIRYKYNCNFIDALRIIDCDFNLGLSSKKDVINCIMKYDMNADTEISADEVYSVCEAKMSWFEKAVYPSKWIVNKFKKDCGFPITYTSIRNKKCFNSCFYRTSIIHKLCNDIK